MIWTDKRLNELSQVSYILETREIPIGKKISLDNIDVKVIDIEKVAEGYHGIAAAPIIEGVADLSQIAVASKGTNVGFNIETRNAINGEILKQIPVADAFVARINARTENKVIALTGESHVGYMLKIGAKYEISTTVFNGWFDYSTLSDKENAFMKANFEMFTDYRKREE